MTRRREGTVSATTAWHLGRVLGSASPPEPRVDHRVPLEVVLGLWADALVHRGPGVVLEVARHARRQRRSLVALLCRAQPTVGHALETFLRYASLATDAYDWRLVRAESELRLETSVAHLPASEALAAQIGFDLLDLAAETRDTGASAPSSIEVELALPREWSRLWSLAAEAPVRGGARRSALVWPAHLWDQAIPDAHEGLRLELERRAEAVLAALPTTPMSVAERARRALPTLLPDASTQSLARQLGLSARGLDRRLSSEGTSYRRIRDETFARLAERWLADGRPLDEVAARLGYQNRASFRRAQRRWSESRPSILSRSLS